MKCPADRVGFRMLNNKGKWINKEVASGTQEEPRFSKATIENVFKEFMKEADNLKSRLFKFIFFRGRIIYEKRTTKSCTIQNRQNNE